MTCAGLGSRLRTLEGGDISGSCVDSVLCASDLVKTIVYTDFGLFTERVTSVIFNSALVIPGKTLTKTLAYTLVGSAYRLDTVTYSLA